MWGVRRPLGPAGGLRKREREVMRELAARQAARRASSRRQRWRLKPRLPPRAVHTGCRPQRAHQYCPDQNTKYELQTRHHCTLLSQANTAAPPSIALLSQTDTAAPPPAHPHWSCPSRRSRGREAAAAHVCRSNDYPLPSRRRGLHAGPACLGRFALPKSQHVGRAADRDGGGVCASRPLRADTETAPLAPAPPGHISGEQGNVRPWPMRGATGLGGRHAPAAHVASSAKKRQARRNLSQHFGLGDCGPVRLDLWRRFDMALFQARRIGGRR